MSRTKKIAILAIICMVLTLMPTALFAATADSTRLSGDNRIATALDIASAGTWGTSVVLAPADNDNLVDALAAAPLAGQENAPILLTFKGSLDAGVKQKIVDLKATKVYVIGAISDAVANEVKALSGVTVEVLKGAGRQATAAAVNAKLTAPAGTFVVGFDAVADALSVASFAAKNKYAIVLANADGSVDSAALKGATKYVVGGATLVKDIAGATRLSGADRFATNSDVVSKLSYSYDRVYVANGVTGLVDALAVAPLAAKYNAFVALASASSVNAVAGATSATKVIAVGGAGVVADAVAAKVYVAPSTLAVESVSAINAKQIEVKFNKDIVRDSVINFTDDANDDNDLLVANLLTITRTTQAGAPDTDKNAVATNATGKLSADGKTLTVTLTVADSKYLDGTYAVTLSEKVVAKDGTKLAPYSTVISTKDNTAPTVASVVYKAATNKIEVTFSEPLKVQPGVVRQDGAAAAGVVFNPNKYKLTFDNEAKKGTTTSVYVALGEDYAANILVAYTGSISVPNDTAALAVNSLTQTGSNEVTIVFNKAIEGADAAAAQTKVKEAVKVLVGSSVYAHNSEATTFTVTRDKNDTTKFAVAFKMTADAADYNFGFYGGDDTKSVTIMFDKDSLKDVFGNLIGGYTQTITMTKDKTAPVVASAKVSSNEDTFEVTFSEKVVVADSAKAHLRLNGVEIGFATAAIHATDSKILVITPNVEQLDGGKLVNGNYNIFFEKGAVKDLYNNDVAAYNSSTISFTANTSATLKATISQNGVALNQFKVVYQKDGVNQEVTSSALNLENYRLDGSVLPAGTDIYFEAVAKDTVIIKLPSGSINYGDAVAGTPAQLTVLNVKDVNGNTVQTKSSSVTVADNTRAVLQSVSLTANMFTLTFNENIKVPAAYTLADFVADFEVKSGLNTLNSTGTAAFTVDGKVLYVTIIPEAGSNWSDVKGGNTITVKAIESGTTGAVAKFVDQNNLKVKSGTQVTVSK